MSILITCTPRHFTFNVALETTTKLDQTESRLLDKLVQLGWRGRCREVLPTREAALEPPAAAPPPAALMPRCVSPADEIHPAAAHSSFRRVEEKAFVAYIRSAILHREEFEGKRLAVSVTTAHLCSGNRDTRQHSPQRRHF